MMCANLPRRMASQSIHSTQTGFMEEHPTVTVKPRNYKRARKIKYRGREVPKGFEGFHTRHKDVAVQGEECGFTRGQERTRGFLG